MSLFGLGKKKDEENKVVENKVVENKVDSGFSCEGSCDIDDTQKATETVASGITKEESVKVLGSGCAKCNQLENNVKTALEQLGMDMGIEHVTDFGQIAAYGVMSTPALVVDGKVVAYGKVLKVDEVVKILENVR